MYKQILSTVLLVSIMTGANADTVSYNESVSGDLNGTQDLLFDVGLNTVAGSIAWSNGGAVSTDFDSFDFILAGGSVLDSIFLDIELQDVGSGTWSRMGWSLNNGPSADVSFPSYAQSLFEDALPLTEGTFDFDQRFASGALVSGDYRVADYSLSFLVSSVNVPEPGSIMLFAIGLIGLVLSRRSMA